MLSLIVSKSVFLLDVCSWKCRNFEYFIHVIVQFISIANRQEENKYKIKIFIIVVCKKQPTKSYDLIFTYLNIF